MICPHCSTAVKYDWYSTRVLNIDDGSQAGTKISYSTCPNCYEIVAYLTTGTLYSGVDGPTIKKVISETLIFPKGSTFLNSTDIPALYLDDYEEAIKVLSASPKASAALSRRLLQSILREEFKIMGKTLDAEIQKFIQLDGIPSHLTDAVDAIRTIGNLAAHPTKNKNTGEIVAVENGEAEWLIEVIEGLFDFVFIQPIKLQRRREELDLKLAEVGKPPLKKKVTTS